MWRAASRACCCAMICVAMAEVPLDGGRRADLMALDARGQIVIVEIKVSRADLLGDGKWTDYLGHCDRFFWAVPAGFDCDAARSARLPARSHRADRRRSLRRGDRPRGGHACRWPRTRRKRCTLAFARRAARRLIDADRSRRDGARLGLIPLRSWGPGTAALPPDFGRVGEQLGDRRRPGVAARHSRAPTCPRS